MNNPAGFLKFFAALKGGQVPAHLQNFLNGGQQQTTQAPPMGQPTQPPLIGAGQSVQPFGGNVFGTHQTDPYGAGQFAFGDFLKKLGLNTGFGGYGR